MALPKFYTATQIHKLWYGSTIKGRKELLFKNDLYKTNTYPIPNLVFVLENATVRVFATKSNLVTSNTHLYNASFLNVWSDGRVCMGNATIKLENIQFFEELIDLVEHNFFNSFFTHTNHNNIVDGSIT